MSRERTNHRSYASNIKKLIIPIVIAAAVIGGALVLLNSGIGQNGKVISYGADSKTAFRVYENGFLQYTKDGVNYYGGTGNKSWSDSYTMTTPIAVERGDYTAIFESDGRSVRVYNDEGLVYNIQTSDTVLSVSLAENGYIGVITGGNSYMVSVYSTSDTMLFQRVEAESGVYPICCDISPDGDIIAIGYMDTTGVNIKSRIGMFYISADKGADYTDSMYSAISKDDDIIFKLYFMSNNSLIAIGDRHILSISSAGVEESSTEVTNEITGVGLCGSKVALAYGDEMPDKEGQEPGTVMFVSSGGKVTAGYSIGTEADYFVTSRGGAVIGSGTSYYGVSSGGSLKWNLNTSGNVTGIYPTSDVDVCIYATRTWAVRDSMVSFDPMEYDTSIISSAAQDEAEDGNVGSADTAETSETGETGETGETPETSGTAEGTDSTDNTGNTDNTDNTGNTDTAETGGAGDTAGDGSSNQPES